VAVLRTRQSFRILVALLACATFSAPLLSTAHLIAVRHAICDHGESIEIVEVDGELHRHAAPCIRESAPAREHGHDHCSIAARRDVRPATQHFAAGSPLRQASPLVEPRQAVAVQQIAILQLAPKSSPPA
jgi:hypothetical protein